MTLAELLEGLSYGVLSGLAIGGDGCGSIPVQHEPKVVHHLNRALTALHGQFVLKTNEVQIRAYDNRTIYPLKKIYADQDAAVVDQKFIVDSVGMPFEEDVIRVTEAYDEAGDKLLFDVDDPDCKLFLPKPNELQIVEPVTGNAYFLIYQAKHPKIVPGDMAQEIILPDVLHSALDAHIAYQILSGMNGQEHAAKGAEHLSTYDMLCSQVTDKDLVGTSVVDTSEKLESRGFK